MADFHSKMSVCRHELGGVQPPTPRQFQPCIHVYHLLTFLVKITTRPTRYGVLAGSAYILCANLVLSARISKLYAWI